MDMSELHRELSNKMTERMHKAPLERAEKEYHEEASAYFKEQRALVAKQSKYTTWTMLTSIAIAIATVVYAIFAILQYLKH